jgi:tripartite-type tricarboxylate transporter receptor subunit TctC
MALFAALAAVAASPACAGESFAGKTITLIIGFAPGGGYDAYGRLAADHLGRFIPGNPTVVAENMEGGRGRRSEVYLGTAAPNDGTVIGIIPNTIALESVQKLIPGDVDAGKFGFIGRLASSVEVIVTSATSPTRTLKDAEGRETIMAAGGSSEASSTVPRILNALLLTQFKLIEGYNSSAAMVLAMQRGEVDGMTLAIPTIKALHPDWIDNKAVNFILVESPERLVEIPNVPALVELATNADQRSILTLICSSAAVGRSLATPPGVSDETLSVLRGAFDAMIKDPDFLADAARRKLAIEPLTGVALQDQVKAIMATPPEAVTRLQEMLKKG